MSLDEKNVLRQFNTTQTGLFARSDRKQLTIYPTSRIPYVTFARDAITMTKVPFDKREDENKTIDLDFIYHEHHYREKPPKTVDKINEDVKKKEDEEKKPTTIPEKFRLWAKNFFRAPQPPAETFVWHTTQENIRQAIFYGIMKVDAPTARIINALGAYRLTVLERIYDKGIISNKYEQKDLFLQITQERIETLQGLERLINLYDESKTVDGNYDAIQATFDDYITDLKKLKNKYKDKADILNEYDEDAYAKVCAQIDRDIGKVGVYKRWLERKMRNGSVTKKFLKNDVLSATGSRSLMGFIKQRMIYATRQLQEHNQNMTYSFSAGSILRGDINSVCEDALKIIFDYQSDQHNPILHSHQGIYQNNSDDPNKKKITVDFSHFEQTPKQVRQTMMAIANIEKLDQIKVEDDGKKDKQGFRKYKLHSNGDSKDLLTTRATKWASNDSAKFITLRVLAWFWNIITGLIFGLLIDLWVGFIAGLFKLNPPCFADKFRWIPQNEKNIKTKFHELEDKVKLPMQSLGTKLGKLIGNFIRNTIYEFVKGFRLVFKEAKIELFDGIKNDYRIGHHGIPDEIDIIKQVEKELTELNEKQKFLKNSIYDQINKFNVTKDPNQKSSSLPVKKSSVNRLTATAPYELSAGEWRDFLNASTDGLKFFLESFTHEIHTKNPFTGLVFNLLYFAGGFAILHPSLVAFLGPKYIAFSEALGSSVGKSTISKAISSALYQAEIGHVGLDTIMNGHSSLLAKTAVKLEEDPSNAVLYAGIAMGIGYLLAFKINIPGLSDELRNDLGTAWPAALTVAGAKVGILLYELLEAEEEKVPAEFTNDDLRTRFKVILKDNFKDLNDKELNESVDEILSDKGLFLIRLEKNKHLLHHISHDSKRNLMELMRQKYPDNPEMRSAMSQQLFPQKKQSILVVTLTTIFDYIPMILRCLMTVITWNKEPWIQLRDKIIKDVTRVFQALNKVAKMFVDFWKIMFRGLCDIVINEIVARFEGFFRNKKHTVSQGSYLVTAGFDSTYDEAREVLGAPIDAMRKASTHPDGHKLSQHQFNDAMTDLYAQRDGNEKVVENPLTEEEFYDVRSDTRKVLSNSESRHRFFSQSSVFYYGLLHKKKSGVLDEHNRLIRGLKSNKLNYEMIRDLIIHNAKVTDKTLHYKAKEILQLALLDKSGRVIIDLLNREYGKTISDLFFRKSNTLQEILLHYSHNHRVMSAIRVDSDDSSYFNRDRNGIKHEFSGIRFCYDKRAKDNFFNSALGSVMNKLLAEGNVNSQNLNIAFDVFSGLLGNLSTQSATAKYLHDSKIYAKHLNTSSTDPQVEQKRLSLNNLLNKLATQKNITKNFLKDFQAPKHDQSITTTASLLTV